jgi:nucleotide-binding universal stress UspA family protein
VSVAAAPRSKKSQRQRNRGRLGPEKEVSMYKKILVPLDGSKLAESVLPHVESLAKCSAGAEVMLVSVTERVSGFRVMDDYSQPTGERLAPEAVGKYDKQARKYLDRIAKTLTDKGIKVMTEVLMGKPADEITFFAVNGGYDLIVMASHGRSGPSRWTHGSVAERVFRSNCAPLLMVQAPGCAGGV